MESPCLIKLVALLQVMQQLIRSATEVSSTYSRNRSHNRKFSVHRNGKRSSNSGVQGATSHGRGGRVAPTNEMVGVVPLALHGPKAVQ